MQIRSGRDYPGSYAELRAWFDQDWKCRDYLDWLRWPEGFVCPKCGTAGGWRAPDGRWRCAGCAAKVSVTAGTIFDKTRTPLTVWFSVAWHLCSSKVGLSATQLQREMQLGSYQTAWAMLHRYRTVMVRPGRDRLRGEVEVDEAFLGGPEPGMPGRGALGKVLFGGAVEREGAGFGRARMAVLDSASAENLRGFLVANVEPGSRIFTDGWSSYPRATRDLYVHDATPVSGSGLEAHEVLPGVHRIFALIKRWLMGVHQGSVAPEHVQAYFDEWVFRFNRRPSHSRGLLFYRLMTQAVDGDVSATRTYARPDANRHHQPRHRGGAAPSRPASNSVRSGCRGGRNAKNDRSTVPRWRPPLRGFLPGLSMLSRGGLPAAPSEHEVPDDRPDRRDEQPEDDGTDGRGALYQPAT